MTEPLVIRCRENGPVVIQGAIKIVDHHGYFSGSRVQGVEFSVLLYHGTNK